MPVPKKRTSISKKKIRKNFWKKKGYKAALKAFSLADSILTGTSKSYRIVINTKPRPFLPRNQKKSCVIVRNTNVGRE
uniref:Large ribosomal subunit protein bL32c n=1 Tax=Vicia faba TaxID=3906 RepID=A0A023I2T2_VICFA|nr:ribosomal protein L32 [Vicia faba]QJQ79542.1 ribosomal protein L32 [Vicia faba]